MIKILVIEDNDTNLYLIRFILEKSGYEVINEKKGIDGVERAKQEKPGLVIMDIQLPDIDGLEATRRIRSWDTDWEIPIIALTSYALVGDEERAYAAGCDGYITKPINPDTFVTSIAAILEKHALRKQEGSK